MEATLIDILRIASETDPSLHVGAGMGPFGPVLLFSGHDCHGHPATFVVSLNVEERSASWWRTVIEAKWRCVACRRLG